MLRQYEWPVDVIYFDIVMVSRIGGSGAVVSKVVARPTRYSRGSTRLNVSRAGPFVPATVVSWPTGTPPKNRPPRPTSPRPWLSVSSGEGRVPAKYRLWCRRGSVDGVVPEPDHRVTRRRPGSERYIRGRVASPPGTPVRPVSTAGYARARACPHHPRRPGGVYRSLGACNDLVRRYRGEVERCNLGRARSLIFQRPAAGAMTRQVYNI